MTSQLKDNKLQSHSKDQSGLTLFEVLIAVLIFSITILGFINFQSVITAQLTHAKNRNQAEKVAFQLLDIYPDSVPINLPNGWQYQVSTSQYNTRCKIVKIHIQSNLAQPNLGEPIIQQRWICQ